MPDSLGLVRHEVPQRVILRFGPRVRQRDVHPLFGLPFRYGPAILALYRRTLETLGPTSVVSVTCMIISRSITPSYRTLNPCFMVCSSDQFRRDACSREVHTGEMPQPFVLPSFEKDALRAVVLACRHDARALVAHTVRPTTQNTWHKLHSDNVQQLMAVLSSHTSMLAISIPATLCRPLADERFTGLQCMFRSASPAYHRQDKAVFPDSHATTPQRWTVDGGGRTASRAEIPGKA